MAASVFKEVEPAPAIEVFKLTKQYKEDTDKNKVNLGVGAYQTDEGKPWVLPVVHTAEAQMVNDKTLNHEYLPVAGLDDFRSAACRLILGPDNPALAESRVIGIQCLGGTGCIRLAAEFLKKVLQYDVVYVSKPTWGNHKGVFKSAGFTQIREYRYWDAASRGLDLAGMKADLMEAPQKSVVILHAVAHNPTGVDPTKEQWKEIADVCKKKGIFVLMDNAYQGFASGNLDEDAYAVRLFVKEGFELFVAQSFSKNFGLYNERTGNLCVVASTKDVINQVKSQLEILVRTMWSNPPNHGGRIVATVLNNESLYSDWKQEVKTMADRISLMRKTMYDKLREKGTPGPWDHIIKQIGMFCYTGLNSQQVEFLIKKHHIYLLKEGRINMCALTTGNINYVVEAIHEAVTTITE